MRTRTLHLFASFMAILLVAIAANATIFGTVKGIVHDGQHRPIQAATVTLKAANSDYTQTQHSDADGAFTFSAVPLGDYTLSVSAKGFHGTSPAIHLRFNPDSSPEFHFPMAIAGVTENVVVSGAPVVALADSATPTTTLSRQNIQDTPGADRTNSMAAITDYVPGAYMVHDMLHIRGGHQFSWMIDGVPVPNTNIATNVGPADRSQGSRLHRSATRQLRRRILAIAPTLASSTPSRAPVSRTQQGMRAHRSTTAATIKPTTRSIAVGTRSGSPTMAVSTETKPISRPGNASAPSLIHDLGAHGLGGFGSLIYNLNPHDQLRLVTSLRQDFFQIPNPLGLRRSASPTPTPPKLWSSRRCRIFSRTTPSLKKTPC